MLRTIKKLLNGKQKQLVFPIFLMTLDAVGGMVLYFILYLTVVNLLGGTLNTNLIKIYSAICLAAVILRLIVYRRGYYLCFSRGAEVCGQMRVELADHYRSLSLGYFNQNSSWVSAQHIDKGFEQF